MSIDPLPVALEMDVTDPDFGERPTLLPADQLTFEIMEGPVARIDIEVNALRNNLFSAASRKEHDATVTNVQVLRPRRRSFTCPLPGGEFMQMTGTMAITWPADRTADDRPNATAH